MTMINFRNAIAAVALGLALAAAASPVLAKERAYRTGQPGHAARAQAIGGEIGEIGESGMSRQRTNAIRTCNERANRYPQHTEGNMQSPAYRVCMMEHGEIE
jgi:hypothetical protein